MKEYVIFSKKVFNCEQAGYIVSTSTCRSMWKSTLKFEILPYVSLLFYKIGDKRYSRFYFIQELATKALQALCISQEKYINDFLIFTFPNKRFNSTFSRMALFEG